MADFITLTPQPVTVTGITAMDVRDAIDVSAYDYLDLQNLVSQAGGSGWILKIETSMQNQSATEGWAQLALLTLATVGQVTVSSSGVPMLQYVRWSVTAGSGGSYTFFIRGMARRFR